MKVKFLEATLFIVTIVSGIMAAIIAVLLTRVTPLSYLRFVTDVLVIELFLISILMVIIVLPIMTLTRFLTRKMFEAVFQVKLKRREDLNPINVISNIFSWFNLLFSAYLFKLI